MAEEEPSESTDGSNSGNSDNASEESLPEPNLDDGIVYELEIPDMDVDVEGVDHPSRDQTHELVAGLPNTIVFSIHNKGEHDFPGGKLTEIELRAGNSGVTYHKEPEIPEIPAGDTGELEMGTNILVEGTVGFKGTLIPEDGKEVNVESTDSATLNEVFRSIAKEDLLILNELNEISDSNTDE